MQIGLHASGLHAEGDAYAKLPQVFITLKAPETRHNTTKQMMQH